MRDDSNQYDSGKSRLPSRERLLAMYEYTPDGRLMFRERSAVMFAKPGQCASWNRRYANRMADVHALSTGYRGVIVFSSKEPAHRVVFKMHHGYEPIHVDHLDGDSQNNRIENLRAADASTNHRNIHKQANNTSGVTGVYYNREAGKWHAQIGLAGQIVFLGRFDTIEAAAAARLAAEQANGFTERHGKDAKRFVEACMNQPAHTGAAK